MNSSRPRRSRDGSNKHPPISKHPSETPIDATSYPLRHLRLVVEDSTQHQHLLHDLDFVDLPDDIILQLFYKADQHESRSLSADGSIIMPPPALRRSNSQIREFFRLGRSQKRQKIEDFSSHIIDKTGRINYTNSVYYEESLENEKRPTVQSTIDPQSPPQQEPPSVWPESPPISVCGGINIQYLQDMRWTTERFKEMAYGFADTQRESLMTRIKLANPRNPFGGWNFEPPVVGALVSGNDQNRVVWTCTEIVNGSEPFMLGCDVDFGRYTFRHVDCDVSDTTEVKHGLCTACLRAKPILLSRFDSNLKLHTSGFNPKRRASMDRTPSLMWDRTDYFATELKKVSRRLSYKEKALAKLIEDTGVDCPINEDSDKIFDITMEQNVKRFLSSDPSDRTAAIAEYVFTEACQKHQQAKLHGRKSIRHSPLVIRLAAAVYASMGGAGGGYDLLARCFNLPTSRNLRNYTEKTASEPDGILHRNLLAAQGYFDGRNPDCPVGDGRRAVVLKLDEMHMRGRFGVDFKTNKVIGISEDALEKTVIERELNELIRLQKDDTVVEEVSIPEPNKKFLVFIATILDKNQTKQQVVVARYGLRQPTAEFIAKRLLELPAALYEYGFIVRHIGCDGATEIRAALHYVGNVAGVTARDVLERMYTEEELRGLPMDFIVGYKHPSVGCEDTIICFGGDMPHWVKKFRNAFDNKSRKLTYKGRIMRLAMLQQIWEATESPDSNLRKTRFSYDYFELDSYKKMRVFLATGFASNSMIDMIRDYCSAGHDNIEHYEGLIELLTAVDRLVDICNAYGADQDTHSKRKRNAYPINTPKHSHVLELLKTLQLFEQWKVECGGYKNTFITWQSHEDLRWLVFGIVCYAALYLKEDGSVVVDQGRFGSDTMEHLFALIRAGNSNPTNQQANEELSRVGANNAVLEANMFRSRGTNTGGAQVAASSYVAELPTRAKRQKRKK